MSPRSTEKEADHPHTPSTFTTKDPPSLSLRIFCRCEINTT
jgi:hypothetical protein